MTQPLVALQRCAKRVHGRGDCVSRRAVEIAIDRRLGAIDADAALQELGSDQIGQAFVTATITVWDGDPGTADEKLRLVEKVIQRLATTIEVLRAERCAGHGGYR